MIDYHIHTERCGHATGTVDLYAGAAVKNGLREIGFADHAPMPEELRAGLTMPVSGIEPYMEEVLECRARCEGILDVRLGMEVDYPLFDSFPAALFRDPRIDFLTGSCHFIEGWAFDHPAHADGFRDRDIDDIYAGYYSVIESMVSSGLFDIVGHFDIVKKFGHRPRKDFLPHIGRIARIMGDSGIAVEINTGGLRHPVGEIYPSPEILRALYDANVPATISSDAHAP
ncbi:MAG: histidinol-phosphatase, partial [Spirochaetes bacterium]|nr:histidinol-phosphatase [Spirochaetota bacterium]